MAKKSRDNGRVDEVVQVALQLFLERGYDNTPMSLLAKRLGFTKPGIYYHFANKEELLFFVHQAAMERQLRPVFEAVAKESDPEQRLRVFLYKYARMLALEPTATLMIREARRLSPEHLREIKKTWQRGFSLVRECIVSLQRQGRCRSDVNPTFAAFAAIGMTSWIAYWFDPKRSESAEPVARTMADIFMGGLTAAATGRSEVVMGKAIASATHGQRRPRKTNRKGLARRKA